MPAAVKLLKETSRTRSEGRGSSALRISGLKKSFPLRWRKRCTFVGSNGWWNGSEVSLLCDSLRVVRSGRAKKFSGNVASELCDRSMNVKEERSQMDSGRDVRRLLLSFNVKVNQLPSYKTVYSLTSNVFREPKRDSSGCSSMILLFQAFTTSRSFASYQFTSLVTLFRESFSGSGGSFCTSFNGSGVKPRWISKRAEGMHGRSLEEMLIAPKTRFGCY